MLRNAIIAGSSVAAVALAAVTSWQGYLTDGGTVATWLQNNAANAALEAQVR
jgi:hypothetical protein